MRDTHTVYLIILIFLQHNSFEDHGQLHVAVFFNLIYM